MYQNSVFDGFIVGSVKLLCSQYGTLRPHFSGDLLELEARIPSNSFAPVYIPIMNHNSSANGRERNHNLTSYQLVGYYKEVFKQTMLNQETIFKDQIQELHRLYGRQRELMNGITRNELDKHNLGTEASKKTTLPQTSPVCTQKTSHIPACSQVSMSGAENIQSPSCFVQKRNIQACSYPVQTEGHSGDRGFLVSKCNKSQKNLDLRLPADTIYIDSEEEEPLEDGTIPEAAEVSSYPTKRIPEVVCNGGATTEFNSISKYASSAVSLKKCLIDLNDHYKLEEEIAPASDSFGGPTAIEAYSRILLQTTEMKKEQLSSSNYNAGKTQISFYSLPRGLYAENLSSSSSSLHKNLKQHEPLSCPHNDQNSSSERAIIGVQYFGKISGQPPSIISDNLTRVNDGLVSELNGVTRYLHDSANGNARKDIDLNFMPPGCSLDAAVSLSSQTTGTENLEDSNERFPFKRPKFDYYDKTDKGCEDSNKAEASNFLSERIHQSRTCETHNIDHCYHSSSSNHHQSSVQDVKNCNRAALLDLNVPCDSVHIKEVELTADEYVKKSKFEKDGGFGVHIDLNSSVSDVHIGVHIDLNASINEDELSAISSPSTESLLEAPDSPENKECSPPRGVSSDENQVDTPDQMSGPEAPENRESSLPTGESDEINVDKPFPVSVLEDFKHKICSQQTESDEQVGTPCPLSAHKDFEHTVCFRPTKSDEQIERPPTLSRQGGLQNKECSQPIESDENQIETPFPSGLDDLECKDCSQYMDCDETQIETPLLLSGQEDLETKECSQPMDCSEKQIRTPFLVSGQEVYLEEELFRTAAECLVSISSSACHTCSERTTYKPSKTSSNSLRWFADLASSVLGSLDNKVGCGDHQEVLPDGMDYFEAMTLKLPETKVEEFCCNKSNGYKEEVMVTASSLCLPKKGRPRKGMQRKKEFRKETLTLSRCEVTEDLQVIGTLIEASADCSETRSVRHAARFGLTRGRRRRTISAINVTEKTAASPLNHIGIKRQLESDKRSLYDWGEVTRRRRGQRNSGSKFMNKVLYAREGAKGIMDRTFVDFPWQVRVEVDGVEIEVPEDAEGVLVANIGSYMGGVDLWQNEDETYDHFDPQSMHDKILEVVSISGTWHLGKLQVGLSRARRLAQGQSIKIRLFTAFPVQIDGEPWFQQPCTLSISHHGQAFMLKRAAEEPLGHAAAIITDVLENAETTHVINASQKRALLQEMALRLT